MIKLKSILLNENHLISRRNKEERLRYYKAATYKKIKQYIKNGCKDNLNLSHTPIDRLPDELKHVGGSLFLSNTQIKSLPKGLKHVSGSLYLSYTEIKSLPDGLTVGGNLVLNNTPIESLPTGLTVGGYLYLYDTLIKSLPKELKIKGQLFLKYTPLSKKYTKDEIKQIIINNGGSVKNVYI